MTMSVKAACVSAVYVLVLGGAERHVLREYVEWIVRVLSSRLKPGAEGDPVGKGERA